MPGPPRIDDVDPGAELAAALADLPAHELNDHLLLSAAVAAHRQVARSQAVLLTMLAELHARSVDAFPDPPPGIDPRMAAADEFSAAAALAPGTASHLVDLGRYLAEEMPQCLDAVALGNLDLAKAKVVHDVTLRLSAEARRRVEDVALELGRTCTPNVTSKARTPTQRGREPADKPPPF